MAMAAEKDHKQGTEASRSSFNGGNNGFVDDNSSEDYDLRYLIVRPENGGIRDLLRYTVKGDIECFSKFLETNFDERERMIEMVDMAAADHRWIIMVSIIIRKIIAFFAKPLEWTGYLVDFLLNLLSLNGNLVGLLCNFYHGNVVIPQRGTETFISTIGHLDGRIDLYKGQKLAEGNIGGNSVREEGGLKAEMGNRALMDLCIMAAKLAYENAQVIRNVVNHHWKMHFVGFYNCWNDFQKEFDTQVFILCDKPIDANLILVSFRGTEPFDAGDWSTDFDYSWYEIPKFGKVHLGFLEALGLGNRIDPLSFHYNLNVKNTKLGSSNGADIGIHSSKESTESVSSTTDPCVDQSSDSAIPPDKAKMTAYYVVGTKLKRLLKEHKNAKFIVTGHGLGGALAILFPSVLVLLEEMEIMERLLGVYTFGQPRIGNRQLARFMETYLQRPVPKYFRVVYCNDLVPRLPHDDKTFLYKHFGVCLYYNGLYIKKRVKEEPNRNFFGLRFLIPEHLNAVWELIRSLTMGYLYGPDYKEGWFSLMSRIIGLAFPGISAHFPTNYVNSIRLGQESSIQMSSF